MNEEELRYLESLGIIGALADRAKSVYEFYTRILGLQVDDIFVSEYVQEDSTREYE